MIFNKNGEPYATFILLVADRMATLKEKVSSNFTWADFFLNIDKIYLVRLKALIK